MTWDWTQVSWTIGKHSTQWASSDILYFYKIKIIFKPVFDPLMGL